MPAYPITESLPPDAPCTVKLWQCRHCGGYTTDCCDRREATGVFIQSQWGEIVWEEWLLLTAEELIRKGDNVFVREGNGSAKYPTGTLTLWREVAE